MELESIRREWNYRKTVAVGFKFLIMSNEEDVSTFITEVSHHWRVLAKVLPST